MKELFKNIYGIIFFCLFRIFPLQNKVVFSTFSGKKYADNPKYVSEKCHELYPEIKQVWLQHKGYKIDVPNYITVVKWPSIKMIYHLATAKVWIDSHTKPVWVRKRKKQMYINTWHGGLGIKKIEGDAIETLPRNSITRSKHNSKIVDIFISNSDWITQIYKRAFWYDGKIIECGYPKNDIIINNEKHEEIIKKVKNYYGIDINAKIMLYAPTFRENNNFNYEINLEQLYKKINNRANEKWVIIYKFHPLVSKENRKISGREGELIDGTQYGDMQELIIASDILITDYSSCMFDAAMLKKPVFIFAQDIEDYTKERGLYFDIKKLPFPFSEKNEQLINNIEKFDFNKYERCLNEYFNEVGLKETGSAAKQISDMIATYIKNENLM